ncbi:MAG: 50S ribosomal protein L17 [Spirochaetes bacterium]|nr:MAG: 50S ribosomal protein L17 [Spirochaetota bacterium]
MNHRVGFNKLGLKESHRKALHRNMATSLFRYERITTTKSKALAVKRTVEKMITRAKVDSVHNRRLVARDIKDKEILAKLFTDIAPRNENRPGGYTRILKLGARQGDAAYMVILELVDKDGESSKKEKAPKKTSKKADKTEKKVEAVKPEPVTEPKESETVKEEAPVEEAVKVVEKKDTATKTE